VSAGVSSRKTIALTDRKNGWTFRLHNDNRRVWLDSFPTDAPVPISFLVGERASEFEVVVGNSRDVCEMMAAARRLLPDRVAVAHFGETDLCPLPTTTSPAGPCADAALRFGVDLLHCDIGGQGA
jgi:hypothetical protein